MADDDARSCRRRRLLLTAAVSGAPSRQAPRRFQCSTDRHGN